MLSRLTVVLTDVCCSHHCVISLGCSRNSSSTAERRQRSVSFYVHPVFSQSIETHLCHMSHFCHSPAIRFKIACITYKTMHITQPAYLNSVLEHYTPGRTLHSTDTHLLFVPCVRTCFGSRSFSVAAHTIWNFLSFDICNSRLIVSFHCRHKTFFQSLAISSASPRSNASDLARVIVRYNLFTF